MAKQRAIPNLAYGAIGLAAFGTASYFVVRELRRRRAASGESTNDTMLDLRRATRNVGRSIKDSVGKLGKDARRGVEDTGEALSEVGDQIGSQVEQRLEPDTTTSYNRI